MDWPRLIFSLALLVIGGALIAYNAVVFMQCVVWKEPARSVAPIFGGVVAAVGVVLLPPASSWHWAWVPLVIDWGGFRIFLWHWISSRTRRRGVD